MQIETKTSEKDVLIEGMRFTPEMLMDIVVDKEKLLSESDSAIRGAKTTSNRDKPKVQKALSILLQIVGLGFLALLFFLVDHPALKAAFGIGFIALLVASIYYNLKKDPDKKFPINFSTENLLEYGGYAILIALGLLAAYYLIELISEYIIWIILIIIFIAWLKDK
jgi:hypothetical protein